MPDDREITKFSRSFRNHTITFDATDMRFHVSGPEFEQYKEEYCRFDSFALAQEKITNEIEANNRLRAKNIKLQEVVYDQHGNLKTITAIHRGTGNIQGIEGRVIYPNVEWIGESLKSHARLRKALNEIDDQVEKFAITVQRGYGKLSAEDYPSKILQLQDHLKKGAEAARAFKTEEAKKEDKDVTEGV